MLTRRENLLIRPWQERRYIQHRQKVLSALPAIDNAPPPFRQHVCYKLKKIQKESERCTQIISDNFTLLQHLSTIMSSTRIDHFWEEPPPNFLQRVGIYSKSSHSSDIEKYEEEELPPPKTRKEKCYACSPNRTKPKVIYDIRRPYTPPKERISKKPETMPDWESQFKSRCDEDRIEFRGKLWKKPFEEVLKIAKPKPKVRPSMKNSIEGESQSIFLSKGGLSIEVKFPSQSDVVVSSTSEKKVYKKTFSEYSKIPRKKSRDQTKGN